MKVYKKNIVIEVGVFKKAYYLLNGEQINCGTFTRSYTNAEIKQIVAEELKENKILDRF